MAVLRRKDRPGVWQARFRGPDGRVISKCFSKRSDAVRWHGEQIAARDRGSFIDPRDGKVTLRAYFDEWSQRQIWARNTVLAMDLAMRSATFADVPLGRIRRSHVEQWVKAMAAEGKSPGTIHTRFVNVRSVLRAAVRDRLIPSDPADGVVLPRQRRREAAMEVPTPEEVRALLSHAEAWFVVFIALAAFAGLRLGEACGVQVADIDFLRRQLHVRRQVQKVSRGKVEVKPPKFGSERVIALPDELLTMLARHVETCETEWLFPSRYGPPSVVKMIYTFEQTAKRAGVNVTIHALRHFAASSLIQAGCDVVQVQRFLGHSTPATTLNTYAHAFREAEDRVRQASANIMSAVMSPDVPQQARKRH